MIIGDTSSLDKINVCQVFVPGEDDNGISHAESVRWVRDLYYSAADDAKIYALVGRRENPTQIWEADVNHYQAPCKLVWIETDTD